MAADDGMSRATAELYQDDLAVEREEDPDLLLARQALDFDSEVAPFRFVDVHWSDPDFRPQRNQINEACFDIKHMMDLRHKYCYVREVVPNQDSTFVQITAMLHNNPYQLPAPVCEQAAAICPGSSMKWCNGVVVLEDAAGQPLAENYMPDYPTFCNDLRNFWNFVKDARNKAICQQRVTWLEKNFEWHKSLNTGIERNDSKDDQQDFFSVMKIDNHLHAASAMTEVQARNMMREHAERDWDLQVMADGTTLGQMFEEQGIQRAGIEFITADKLNHSADSSMFHRFDNFNDSYNPMSSKAIREVFMKTSNFTDGKYFASSMKDMVYRNLDSQEANGSTVGVEPRLSIYGRKRTGWLDLAKWWLNNEMCKSDKVRWVVQLPRLYGVWAKCGFVKNFGEYLRNVFEPLFEATLHPEEHPEIALFLLHLGFVDSVDDESQSANDPLIHAESSDPIYPDDYDQQINPPYSYYMYYTGANLTALNRLREKMHLNTIPNKPHCGEAGNVHHLATAYLMAESINHGIQLAHSPTLKYMYYLNQIGLGMCPLSNNALFCKLNASPIGSFIKCGLKVALGTDDPLQFHITQEPLMEEYSNARNLWNLTMVDLTELARNSVDISAFDPIFKTKWLGENHNELGLGGNNPAKTNLTQVRTKFRTDAWLREISWVIRHADEMGETTTNASYQARAKDADVRCGPIQVNDILWDLKQLPLDNKNIRGSEAMVQDDIETQQLKAQIRQLQQQLRARPTPAAASPTDIVLKLQRALEQQKQEMVQIQNRHRQETESMHQKHEMQFKAMQQELEQLGPITQAVKSVNESFLGAEFSASECLSRGVEWQVVKADARKAGWNKSSWNRALQVSLQM